MTSQTPVSLAIFIYVVTLNKTPPKAPHRELSPRRNFLLVLGRALMTYGAPLCYVKSQLSKMSRYLGLGTSGLKVIRLPDRAILLLFPFSTHPPRGIRPAYISQSNNSCFLAVGGRLNLDKLIKIREVCNLVVKSFGSATSGTQWLLDLDVRVTGGEFSPWHIRGIERMLFTIHELYYRGPHPITYWRRNNWERTLARTRSKGVFGDVPLPPLSISPST